MTLEKIPKFDEVKEWAQDQGWVTSEEAADSAPVQSVDSETGDVTLNYADQNHSDRHEDGGPDELEASNLSLAGSSSQFLSGSGWTTPPSGVAPDDITEETGTFNADTFGSVEETTVNFDTDFDVITGMDASNAPTDSQFDARIYFAASIESFTTSSMTISYSSGENAEGTVTWRVWGVNQ